MFFLPESIVKSGKINLWVESAANSLCGTLLKEEVNHGPINPDGEFPAQVTSLRMTRFNRKAWELQRDFEVLYDLYTNLPQGYRTKQLLCALNNAINAYGYALNNAQRARAELATQLAQPATASALTAIAVGHAHIDTGWLWPVSETIRKVARTFASQLSLIERNHGYVFGASQPQLYAFAKEYYPELYQRVKKAVADARWELQGGMWVEADCNLISGESMVRQFIHGKNFYRDEFGVDVKTLWIPDVFGYAASMPQIIKKSGCDYFLTQKISWNQFNKFPYHTFFWRGIDGTQVLTHFPPEDTYNAMCFPQTLLLAANQFNEAPVANSFMSLMGIGDGGGDPEERFIARAKRMANLERLPKYQFGKSSDFFERSAAYQDKLPT